MAKKIIFRIGKNTEAMKEVNTDEGALYITKDKKDIFYGDADGEKKQIVNHNCLNESEVSFASFGPSILAVLGKMSLNYTKIFDRE